jgi:multiple antibiotic resistance protein
MNVESPSFVFTILFMLVGPMRLIPAFGGATRGMDETFKRSVAIRAALIASAVFAFVAIVGPRLVAKYHVSLDGLRVGGGVVLTIAALNGLFRRPQTPAAAPSGVKPIRFAVSPIVTPLMLPPAGVAAVLILMMLAPGTPGMALVVGVALSIIMVLDLLVMFFITGIMSAPWLMLVLQPLGAVLGFLQLCLGIESMVAGLRNMGVF